MAVILIIDDDHEVLEINKKYLTGEGFEVHIASSAKQGLNLAKQYSPDCILLDIMMPEMNGYEVCRLLRTFTSAPILFLTGKSSEDDKITGLTCGADDYIVKPYSLRELKARVDILLLRMGQLKAASDNHSLVIGNLTIDKVAHKALFHGEDLRLANREYEVLLYMAEHPDRDISFEELGNALFGTYMEADRRSVMVNVSRLRKKFDGSHELSNHIETVWGKGYRFIITSYRQ
ncbi:MAG: response regulator transcription factor [Lachnospiraceae bacterium]|nr:response regulator transcription factor [Lachnospiraceae bacterium]